MDARRWQSPAAVAAEAAEEDAGAGCGGAGGPSNRPPRRGLHRASPYGLGPRRWLPKLPVASRIFPTVSRDHTASDDNLMDQCESLEVTHEGQSTEPNTNAFANAVPTPVNNKVNLLLEGDYKNRNDGSGLAEIEKIIKQNIFSRVERERLIEIMCSRTPDLCDEDQRAPRSFAKGFQATRPHHFQTYCQPLQNQLIFNHLWGPISFHRQMCMMLVLHQLNLQKLIWKHMPQHLYMSLKGENSEL